MNLGDHVGDDPADVRRNRSEVRDALGLGRIAFMSQVHGTAVGEVAPIGSAPPECDALLSTTNGIGVAALAADCVPVAIGGASSVAVIHAGWRGLADGVIESAVSHQRDLDAGELEAAIGPSAGACCYEVSAEVAAAVGSRFSDEDLKLDLRRAAAERLAAMGVLVVSTSPCCTICDPEHRFFSYRSSGPVTGRQGVVAWLSN